MQNQNNLDESISATIASLKTALSEVHSNDGTGTNSISNECSCPSIFTDEKVLARPPFTYVQALAKFFSEQKPSLGWAELLFGNHCTGNCESNGNGNDNDHFEHRNECCLMSSKKEKLTFLSRLLALVSQISGKRFDVLIAPSKILCGQDVLSTHEFLRALASSINAPEQDMAKAVKFVLEEGDGNLYKRGVRTRKSFTSVQALVRGWQVRRMHQRSNDSVEAMKVDGDKCSTFSEQDTNNESDGKAELKDQPGKTRARTDKIQPEKAKMKSKKSKPDQDALLESYEAVLSRKSKMEDELKVAEAKLKKENNKLIRILSLGTKHKTQTRTQVVPYGGMPRPPLSAPSIGMNTNNNTVTINNGLYKIDESFSEKITNFSQRQRTMKQKERRIDDRESKLKQRFARSKQKDVELKLQEERISDLAGKIRNQQIQLKEQRLQFERSKILENPDDSLPPETTRPCVMCTEKKIQMREIRSKIRQRTRALNQREAVVIGRAQELRRREIQLAKREQVIVDWEQQSTVVDDYLSEYSSYEEPPPSREKRPDSKNRSRHKNEKHHEKHHHNDHHENEIREPIETETSLPEVRDDASASNPALRDKGARKRRRRRSPQEGSSALSQMEGEEELLRPSSSYGESIPTILEETTADEQDEQNTTVEEDGIDNATTKANESASANNDVECPLVEETMGPMAFDENIVPTDIREARKRLGISKSKNTGPPPRRISGRKSQIHDEKKDEPKIERRISQPPPPKQRHVFAFERRESSQQNNKMHRGPSAEPRKSIINSGDRSRRISGVTPVRERRENKKPKKASPNKHDDWISSFDVQMKCAMNRLKELV